MKILKIIKKDFKILLRSRTSALVVIFGPLLLILMVGLAFNTSSTYKVVVGVYSQNYSQLANSFIQELNPNQFRVVKYNSKNKCVEEVRQGAVHTCIIFPQNFSISENNANDITYYVDYSRVNLVYTIIDAISKKITSRSLELTADLTTILLDKLTSTQNEIKNKSSILHSLISGNENMKKQSDETKKNLNNLDLLFDKNSLKIKTLKMRANSMAGNTIYLKSNAQLAISEATDLIDNVEEEINNLNLNSSEKSVIENILNDAKNNINTTSTKINSVNTSSTELISLINELDKKLDDIGNKINKASSTRTSAVKKIENIRSLLEGSSASMNKIQTSFQNINSNIENIEIKNVESIVSPIKTTIKPVIAKKAPLHYVFPGIIALFIVFISVLLSSVVVQMEKRSNAHFRNLITPTRDIIFVTGTFLTSFIIVFIQIIVVLGVAAYFFKVNLVSFLPDITLVLFAITTPFTLIGMFIGYLFNSEDTTILAAISTGSVFLLLSNFILPIENMPAFIMRFARFNPFVISEFILKQIIMFQTPVMNLAESYKLMQYQFTINPLYLLLIYSLLIFVFIIIVEKLVKKNFLYKYGMKLISFGIIRKKKV